MNRWLRVVLGLVCLLMLADFVFRGVLPFVSRNDFSEVYVGSRLWRHGQNFYDSDLTRVTATRLTGSHVNLVLIYPPTALVLIAPFSFLPWNWADTIWHILGLVGIGITIFLLLRLGRFRLGSDRAGTDDRFHGRRDAVSCKHQPGDPLSVTASRHSDQRIRELPVRVRCRDLGLCRVAGTISDIGSAGCFFVAGFEFHFSLPQRLRCDDPGAGAVLGVRRKRRTHELEQTRNLRSVPVDDVARTLVSDPIGAALERRGDRLLVVEAAGGAIFYMAAAGSECGPALCPGYCRPRIKNAERQLSKRRCGARGRIVSLSGESGIR